MGISKELAIKVATYTGYAVGGMGLTYGIGKLLKSRKDEKDNDRLKQRLDALERLQREINK